MGTAKQEGGPRKNKKFGRRKKYPKYVQYKRSIIHKTTGKMPIAGEKCYWHLSIYNEI